MGVDLKLINDLWKAAQQAFHDEWMERSAGVGAAVLDEIKDEIVNYPPILFAGIALLKDKALAQRFLDETWEP